MGVEGVWTDLVITVLYLSLLSKFIINRALEDGAKINWHLPISSRIWIVAKVLTTFFPMSVPSFNQVGIMARLLCNQP